MGRIGSWAWLSRSASMASMGVVNSGYQRECSAAGINETSRMTLIRRIASNKRRSNESIHLANVLGLSRCVIEDDAFLSFLHEMDNNFGGIGCPGIVEKENFLNYRVINKYYRL